MLLAVTEVCLAADPAGSTAFRPSDPLNQAAFEHYYNLDHDTAIQDFERILASHPNDPFAVNHLLSAIQVRELYRMGAMTTGEYANDSFIGQAQRPADPAQKQRIKQLVQRAEKLEDAELARNPKNVDMLYARGVTRGQFALYSALIERAWFSALRNAVGARRDHERVLELDPRYGDALQIASAIGPRFPRNYLLPLEEANLLRASGKSGEADEQYRRVWQNGREGKYGSLHYEIAALGLGDLLRSQKKYQAAATAYELVSQVTGADPELLQKANLGAGEMYDQLQKRDLAVKKYEAVVATNAGNAEAEKARKRIKDADPE